MNETESRSRTSTVGPLVQGPLRSGASCRCQSTIFPTGLCSQVSVALGLQTSEVQEESGRTKDKDIRSLQILPFVKLSSRFAFLLQKERPSFAFPSASHWPDFAEGPPMTRELGWRMFSLGTLLLRKREVMETGQQLVASTVLQGFWGEIAGFKSYFYFFLSPLPFGTISLFCIPVGLFLFCSFTFFFI